MLLGRKTTRNKQTNVAVIVRDLIRRDGQTSRASVSEDLDLGSNLGPVKLMTQNLILVAFKCSAKYPPPLLEAMIEAVKWPIIMTLLCHLASTICTIRIIKHFLRIIWLAFLKHHILHKLCIFNTK